MTWGSYRAPARGHRGYVGPGVQARPRTPGPRAGGADGHYVRDRRGRPSSPAPRGGAGPGRPGVHFRIVQHPAQACHRIASAADAGLLLRYEHAPPSQHATELLRRGIKLALHPQNGCARLLYVRDLQSRLRAQRADGSRLHAQRAQGFSSATAQLHDVLRDTHGFRVFVAFVFLCYITAAAAAGRVSLGGLT